jgi:predicted nuclease of predicted toxin-antitoxin system
MKILIDMNLSPEWVEIFKQQDWDAIHWSEAGDIKATDKVIMEWAKERGYIVFTHDLDFGALLAATHSNGPSVIQVRTQDVMPQTLGSRLVQILQKYKTTLENGAFITVDEVRARVKILPF